MHAGQFASISDVLAHYNRAPTAPAGKTELKRLRLSDSELRQLEAFLNTLVSPVGLSAIPAARIARVVSPPMLDRFAPHMVPRWLVARLLRLTYGNPERVTERDIDEYWAPSLNSVLRQRTSPLFSSSATMLPRKLQQG